MFVKETYLYLKTKCIQILTSLILIKYWMLSKSAELTIHSKNRVTWLLALLTSGRSEGKSERFLKIDPNFNISFPNTARSLTFHKTNVLHNDLKKDAINEFGIKYWTSNPVWVKFQEHGNIEEKVWLLVKKNMDLKKLTGRLKLRFLTEIGRFHWNQGEEVAHCV